MASRKVENYTGARVTVHSNQSFDSVLSKLYGSIGAPATGGEWPKIAGGVATNSVQSRDAFIALVEKVVGPHGFMIFQELNHGVWIPLYDVGGGVQVKRIILGNPLIAITMLKHDLTAGLAVPVELLLLEKRKEEGGGVDLIYQLPSALIAGLNKDPELVKAVGSLDEKLSTLVDFVAS